MAAVLLHASRAAAARAARCRRSSAPPLPPPPPTATRLPGLWRALPSCSHPWGTHTSTHTRRQWRRASAPPCLLPTRCCCSTSRLLLFHAGSSLHAHTPAARPAIGRQPCGRQPCGAACSRAVGRIRIARESARPWAWDLHASAAALLAHLLQCKARTQLSQAVTQGP